MIQKKDETEPRDAARTEKYMSSQVYSRVSLAS